MDLCVYHPSTQPGSQLPHVWLSNNSSSERQSTRELLRGDKCILLAMSKGWTKIQHPLIEVVIINSDGDFTDVDGNWKAVCGEHESSSALLVRPDSIIAFRWSDEAILGHSDLNLEISNIMAKVLRLEM